MVSDIDSIIERYPDSITISGSTKRAGFTVRGNADFPSEFKGRIGRIVELAKQATQMYESE